MTPLAWIDATWRRRSEAGGVDSESGNGMGRLLDVTGRLR
jgi:hypothetical protein